MVKNLEPNLLSSEATIVGIDDDDDDGDENGKNDDKNRIFSDERSNSQVGFPLESEKFNREMMEREREREHLPRDDYLKRLRTGDLDLNVRREALEWIWKACEQHHFGPLCICLSTNYLDRFLSVHDLPSGKAWTVRLLAVACLSLAAKMEETEVPRLIDLQIGDPRFVFEAKTIQRMELLVLNKLKWRLRVITPCSFIRYFLRKISGIDQEPSGTLISRSLQVIVSTTKGIDFLEFRPSEVAAAVAISVSGEIQAVHFEKSISSFLHLQKERVKKIVEMIGIDGSASSSQTPNGVLEVSSSCFSVRTDDSATHCTVSPSFDSIKRTRHDS